MKLPNKIFFTGVPGSYWSGIAQILEKVPEINTSDHSEKRQYVRESFTGHKGSYFGTGMEFPATLNEDNLNSPWTEQSGTKIIKSHEWCEKYLDDIKQKYPNEWIMLVYRPSSKCFAWWYEAGGFKITYPNYANYKNEFGIMQAIDEGNCNMLEFAAKYNTQWNYFTADWIKQHFGVQVPVLKNYSDVLVSLIK